MRDVSSRHRLLTFGEYQSHVRRTDKLPPDGLLLPILGVFGEVGSVVAVVKKRARDGKVFGYEGALIEEIGDVLWYLTCTASRVGVELADLSRDVVLRYSRYSAGAGDEMSWNSLEQAGAPAATLEEDVALAALAASSGELMSDVHVRGEGAALDYAQLKLRNVLHALVELCAVMKVSLHDAALANVTKIAGRWPVAPIYPPLPDDAMPHHEQLPRELDIHIEEMTVSGRTYVLQRCNGLIVGDRLTDNKSEPDDYRFHDVFHLAYAVHLGWSPVLRSLFKVKRKSVPAVDENQDGARAVLIEEGISTFVFARGLERDLFRDAERVDLDLLNFAARFVAGYEPQSCALWQWERAILDGFSVFRELKRLRMGVVRADLRARSLTFRPLRLGEHLTVA